MKNNIVQQCLCYFALTEISKHILYPELKVEADNIQTSHISGLHSYHSFISYLASFIYNPFKSRIKGISYCFSFVDIHRQEMVFPIKLEKPALR